MQQPIYQEQQGNQQGSGPQMLLCPVRLVYETQILVQPGEQIQPNQTIFINPQNPPPWIQNRPQNQVIYVQQMAPNNFMPHVQQHTGQNPLYVQQNYNNLQQIMSQQVLSQAQSEEVRSANVQMANMLQRGTVQVSQSSSVPSNPNATTAVGPTSNYGMLPPYYTNIPNVPNIPNQGNQGQISFIPANVAGKQMVANIQTAQKIVPPNTANLPRNVEVQQNLYRPVLQQTYHQESNITNNPLPQSITMVPMQSPAQQKLSMAATTIDQNVAQIRPLQTQIATAAMLPQSTATVTVANEKMMRKVAPITPKGNTTMINQLNTPNKNAPTYSYRPIQPRPQQQRHFVPNIMPANSHTQITHPTQATNNNSSVTQNFPIPTTLATSYIKTEQNVINRKRKSESPDEIQKKMAPNIVTQKTINIPPVPITTSTYSDVGVNTISLQRINNKLNSNTVPINQSITINRTNDSKQLNKDNLLQRIDSQKETDRQQTSETEKLLRNTVYTQARNRVLADKQDTVNTNIVKVESKPADIKLEPSTEKEVNKDLADKIESNKEVVKKEEIKQPNVVEAKKENESKAPSEGETVKEINLLGNGKTNENGFVLTHVLDGYVIQESNIAFPIRKPLQERTIQHNIEDLEIKKEEDRNSKSDQTGSKLCNLSLLNLNEEKVTDDEKTIGAEQTEKCKDNDKDNPFAELKPQTVKSWTVEQLTAHLQKYNWDDTVLVLREHEIDGESLFLVSKNQLMTIGVNEEHASAICHFVKS